MILQEGLPVDGPVIEVDLRPRVDVGRARTRVRGGLGRWHPGSGRVGGAGADRRPGGTGAPATCAWPGSGIGVTG